MEHTAVLSRSTEQDAVNNGVTISGILVSSTNTDHGHKDIDRQGLASSFVNRVFGITISCRLPSPL